MSIFHFCSESKRQKLSASIFDTAPDLNVPMDIFDHEDEDEESGNPIGSSGSNRTHFDAESPDQTIGQSVLSAFDVTDFQVCSLLLTIIWDFEGWWAYFSAWAIKIAFPAFLCIEYLVHFCTVTMLLMATKVALVFEGTQLGERFQFLTFIVIG